MGAFLGPPLAAGLIVVLGADQFFVAVLATHAVIAGFLAFRILTRDGLPMGRQRHYIPFPARASAVAANLFARRPSGRRAATRPGSGSAPR